MEQRSFFGELKHRRIAQILGMYVAAAWMAVEIGEWMVERYGLPDTVTAYIFIGLIALAPSVVMLAWGHGARGKDKWTSLQGVFLLFNIMLATVAMVKLVKPPAERPTETQPMALIETREFTDESGNTITYEVARAGFHQRLLAFFWRNETGKAELDWLCYGLPWLLTEDLQRSPLVSASTPFGSASVIDRLRSAGFDQALGEPLSLDLQIARTRGLRHIVTGQLEETENGLCLTARVHDVETGGLIGEWTETGADLLESIERLSSSISDELLEKANTNAALAHLSINEHTCGSLPAIEKMIQALRHRALLNQYPEAIQATREALKLDPGFAQAHVEAMSMYWALGEISKAMEEAQAALAMGYKLYSERKFEVKATTYALQLQRDKVLRVLEMWRDVHPDSIKAHELLAKNYLALGKRFEDAKTSFRRVLELDPSYEIVLLSIAAIFQHMEQPDEALKIIRQYLKTNPQDVAAHRQLGWALIQAGELEDARRAFEELEFLDTNNPVAGLDLAKLMVLEENFGQAYHYLERMLNKRLTERQRHEVLSVVLTLQERTGKTRAAKQTLEEMDHRAKSFMIPVLRKWTLGVRKAAHSVKIGLGKEALAELEKLRDGLQYPFNQMVTDAMRILSQQLDDLETVRDSQAKLGKFSTDNLLPGIIPGSIHNYPMKIDPWDGQAPFPRPDTGP